ncbi:uncharacterized protein LOC121000781 [Bufo bufo]|uniref:uncharacterized protein LOC121000781 n=1 Tax=Bufo bufo TaxID=8384 RepID=UPI001ABEA18B|nr:uncharacterized protein LOC121000781 [Bufo bufo]
MSDGNLPVRRIGTRAAVRQEASNMAESDASSSSEPAPSTPQKLDNSPKLEALLEPKPEPMDTSPPASIDQPLSLMQTAPILTTVQLKDAVLLPPLGPSLYSGRKRKANFSNEETETLVRDVVEHFSALYGSEALRTESTRRNQRRSQLWTQIQKNVNELGYTPRSIDDLKHKWRDLRLEVKRKITHRRTGTKETPAPVGTPAIDTKLSQLEDLVASTIGHHCTLDGEQEGMYMEPGVPRQSIFFSCRGGIGDMGSDRGCDRMGTTASPRPTLEKSVASPLVSASPAQLSFIRLTEDVENGEREKDVVPGVQIKTFPDTWTAMKEVCTLVTTQNLIPAQRTIVTAPPEILTVKQEVLTAKPVLAPARCESQNSIVSSPEGSLGNPAGQTEQNAGGSDCGDNNSSSSPAMSVVKTDGETVQLKVESEGGDSQEAGKDSPEQDDDRGNWQENQDEWERQSHSPQLSDNAQDDSMPSSSSQDGDPSSGGELPANGDCSFDPDDRKAPCKSNMSRLLELEEQWDRLYHRELGLWEEERMQQQQQRNQDRELQQQLLGVLTDIRDELRQLRQERAVARQNQAAAATASLAVTNTSTIAPTKPNTESPTVAETPSTPVTARRRGRPRLIKPAPEPARPIRPQPDPSTKS